MGMALSHFLLDTKTNGGILLLGIVGVGILLSLVIASCCISLKVGKIYRQLCHAPDVVHLLLLYEAFSGFQRQVMDVFIEAAENTEIPVHRTDNEPLQELFMLVRIKLYLDHKNIKQEQAKFWKQHPALAKTELFIQAQLTLEPTTLSPSLVETKLRSKGR